MNEVSFAERVSALDERERDIQAREEAARKAVADALHASNVSFAEGLSGAAKLAPVGRALLVGVLDHLDATAVVSFGEAGDMTPAAALKKLFDSAVPLVSFSEHGQKPKDDKSYTSFAAPEGYDVDPEQVALHAKAMTIQQDNAGMSWLDAVKRAQAGG